MEDAIVQEVKVIAVIDAMTIAIEAVHKIDVIVVAIAVTASVLNKL